MSGAYNQAKEDLATGRLSWDDVTRDFVAIAVDDAYVFDPDHQFLSQVTANELSGTGTRAPVESRSVVKNLTADRSELNAVDSTFPLIDAGTIGFIVVAEATPPLDTDRHLVGWMSADGAGASFALPTNGADILIAWPGGRVARID